MACSIKYARPPLDLDSWEQIGRCLEPAIAVSRGKFAFSDVKKMIESGKFHLLVVVDEADAVVAALTAALITYPQMKVLEVSFLGGSRGMEWGRDMLFAVENMAKIAACSRIEFRGRKEWGSVLRNDGYEAVGTLYGKVISPWATPVSEASEISGTSRPPIQH